MTTLIQKFNIETGNVEWKNQIGSGGDQIYAYIAYVDAEYTYIYTNENNFPDPTDERWTNILKIDSTDGSLIWSQTIFFTSGFGLGDPQVYVGPAGIFSVTRPAGNQSVTINKYSLTDCSLDWSKELTWSNPDHPSFTYRINTSSPFLSVFDRFAVGGNYFYALLQWVSDEYVTFPISDYSPNMLIALDEGDGSQGWSASFPADVRTVDSSLSDMFMRYDDGRILLVSDRQYEGDGLYAVHLNAGTGHYIEEFDIHVNSDDEVVMSNYSFEAAEAAGI